MTCPSCRAHQLRAVAMRRIALHATQQIPDHARRRDLTRLIHDIGEDLPPTRQHQPVTPPLGRTQRDLLRRLQHGPRTIPNLATTNPQNTLAALTRLALRGYTKPHPDGTWTLTTLGHTTIHHPEADT